MFLLISLLALAAVVSAYDYTRNNRSLVLLTSNYTRLQPPVLTNRTRPVPTNRTRSQPPVLTNRTRAASTNRTRVQPAVTTVNTTTPMPAPAAAAAAVPRSLRRS